METHYSQSLVAYKESKEFKRLIAHCRRQGCEMHYTEHYILDAFRRGYLAREKIVIAKEMIKRAKKIEQ